MLSSISPYTLHLSVTKMPARRGDDPSDRDDAPQPYMSQEVTPRWADTVLIVMCFATGLLDSAVFNVWSCFVSMQTGA